MAHTFEAYCSTKESDLRQLYQTLDEVKKRLAAKPTSVDPSASDEDEKLTNDEEVQKNLEYQISHFVEDTLSNSTLNFPEDEAVQIAIRERLAPVALDFEEHDKKVERGWRKAAAVKPRFLPTCVTKNEVIKNWKTRGSWETLTPRLRQKVENLEAIMALIPHAGQVSFANMVVTYANSKGKPSDQVRPTNRAFFLQAFPGAGKTVAYLLHTIGDLVKTKDDPQNVCSPIVLIVCCSADTVANTHDQVLSNFGLTDKTVVKLHKDISWNTPGQAKDCKILITTLGKLLNDSFTSWHRLKHIIVDEADATVTTPDFLGLLASLKYGGPPDQDRRDSRKARNIVSLIFASATVPVPKDEILIKQWSADLLWAVNEGQFAGTPEYVRVDVTETLSHIIHEIVEAPSDRYEHLQRLFDRVKQVIASPQSAKVIVFARSHEVDVLRDYAAKIPELEASLSWLRSLKLAGQNVLDRQVESAQFAGLVVNSGEHALLITSDNNCRGVDFKRVTHGFQFEINPYSAAYYIQRVGRIMRNTPVNSKQRGKSVAFLVPKNFDPHVHADILRFIGECNGQRTANADNDSQASAIPKYLSTNISHITNVHPTLPSLVNATPALRTVAVPLPKECLLDIDARLVHCDDVDVRWVPRDAHLPFYIGAECDAVDAQFTEEREFVINSVVPSIDPFLDVELEWKENSNDKAVRRNVRQAAANLACLPAPSQTDKSKVPFPALMCTGPKKNDPKRLTDWTVWQPKQLNNLYEHVLEIRYAAVRIRIAEAEAALNDSRTSADDSKRIDKHVKHRLEALAKTFCASVHSLLLICDATALSKLAPIGRYWDNPDDDMCLAAADGLPDHVGALYTFMPKVDENSGDTSGGVLRLTWGSTEETSKLTFVHSDLTADDVTLVNWKPDDVYDAPDDLHNLDVTVRADLLEISVGEHTSNRESETLPGRLLHLSVVRCQRHGTFIAASYRLNGVPYVRELRRRLVVPPNKWPFLRALIGSRGKVQSSSASWLSDRIKYRFADRNIRDTLSEAFCSVRKPVIRRAIDERRPVVHIEDHVVSIAAETLRSLDKPRDDDQDLKIKVAESLASVYEKHCADTRHSMPRLVLYPHQRFFKFVFRWAWSVCQAFALPGFLSSKDTETSVGRILDAVRTVVTSMSTARKTTPAAAKFDDLMSRLAEDPERHVFKRFVNFMVDVLAFFRENSCYQDVLTQCVDRVTGKRINDRQARRNCFDRWMFFQSGSPMSWWELQKFCRELQFVQEVVDLNDSEVNLRCTLTGQEWKTELPLSKYQHYGVNIASNNGTEIARRLREHNYLAICLAKGAKLLRNLTEELPRNYSCCLCIEALFDDSHNVPARLYKESDSAAGPLSDALAAVLISSTSNDADQWDVVVIVGVAPPPDLKMKVLIRLLTESETRTGSPVARTGSPVVLDVVPRTAWSAENAETVIFQILRNLALFDLITAVSKTNDFLQNHQTPLATVAVKEMRVRWRLAEPRMKLPPAPNLLKERVEYETKTVRRVDWTTDVSVLNTSNEQKDFATVPFLESRQETKFPRATNEKHAYEGLLALMSFTTKCTATLWREVCFAIMLCGRTLFVAGNKPIKKGFTVSQLAVQGDNQLGEVRKEPLSVEDEAAARRAFLMCCMRLLMFAKGRRLSGPTAVDEFDTDERIRSLALLILTSESSTTFLNDEAYSSMKVDDSTSLCAALTKLLCRLRNWSETSNVGSLISRALKDSTFVSPMTKALDLIEFNSAIDISDWMHPEPLARDLGKPFSEQPIHCEVRMGFLCRELYQARNKYFPKQGLSQYICICERANCAGCSFTLEHHLQVPRSRLLYTSDRYFPSWFGGTPLLVNGLLHPGFFANLKATLERVDPSATICTHTVNGNDEQLMRACQFLHVFLKEGLLPCVGSPAPATHARLQLDFHSKESICCASFTFVRSNHKPLNNPEQTCTGWALQEMVFES